jgi:hypothetical protein
VCLRALSSFSACTHQPADIDIVREASHEPHTPPRQADTLSHLRVSNITSAHPLSLFPGRHREIARASRLERTPQGAATVWILRKSTSPACRGQTTGSSRRTDTTSTHCHAIQTFFREKQHLRLFSQSWKALTAHPLISWLACPAHHITHGPPC